VLKWKRNAQFARQFTQRLMPKRSIAVTRALKEPTKQNNGAKTQSSLNYF